MIKGEDVFDSNYLESIGYKVVSDDGVYGKAESIRPKGKKILSWNREGTEINYFGDKIPFAYFIGIKDDGGTRTSFNGIVRNKEDLKFILESTI
jgi:hypothetical protein